MLSWCSHVMKPETRVSLVLLHDVFVAMDPTSDVDLDEVECILINLIAKVRMDSRQAHSHTEPVPESGRP